MKKEDQTPEMLKHLFDLTQTYVRFWKPRVYWQYHGDLYDLGTEIFVQFITPKSRVKGKEETLLDKFDPTITNLNYLVSLSVKRMLIDRSRANPYQFKSIEAFVDEFGDMMTKSFNLTTEAVEDTVDEVVFSPNLIKSFRRRFAKLPDSVKASFRRQYNEMKSVFSANYRKLFDGFINACDPLYIEVYMDGQSDEYICQQITDKTVCVMIGDSVYNFDRFTGRCKHSGLSGKWCLPLSQVDKIKEISTYKSGFSREGIVSYYFSR